MGREDDPPYEVDTKVPRQPIEASREAWVVGGAHSKPLVVLLPHAEDRALLQVALEGGQVDSLPYVEEVGKVDCDHKAGADDVVEDTGCTFD